jgi:molybdopterin-guanine dinucleotide biosynthesis protein A
MNVYPITVYNHRMLTIVVQAGGESRRMGEDKALRPFLGRPLIQRVLDRVSPLADELLVTTNTPEKYTFLKLALIPDILPGRGALGGLYTALQAAQHELVAIVACDMPFVNPELLAAQRDWLSDPALDVVIPRSAGGTEPFHAVYRRSTCLPAIQNAIEADKWRVDAWFSRVKIRWVQPDEAAQFDPHQLAFWNVNTPEEFKQAELIAH